MKENKLPYLLPIRSIIFLLIFAMTGLLVCMGCAGKQGKEQQPNPSLERIGQDNSAPSAERRGQDISDSSEERTGQDNSDSSEERTGQDNSAPSAERTGQDNSDSSEERTGQDIIEKLVVYHGTYGEESLQKEEELLKELGEKNPRQGEKWTEIMMLWRNVNLDLALNYNYLPDGLDDSDALCLVALGFQLNPDGSMNDELIERLNVVLNSAEKYPNALIVCTGGGTASENPDATEAGKMAEWLIEKGIDANRVIVEDQSITTAQNAIYSCEILQKKYPQVNQLAIISSDYHIATGQLLFGAESILLSDEAGNKPFTIVSNAAWKAPSGTLSSMFQAGALIELSGDVETAFDIYYKNYDIHELPPIE